MKLQTRLEKLHKQHVLSARYYGKRSLSYEEWLAFRIVGNGLMNR